jgi:membrane protease YdiL (CAAX protease family)
MIHKTEQRQVCRFIVVCLPITWILVWCAGWIDVDYAAPASQLLAVLACFIPMVTATILTLGERKLLRKLGIFPRLQGNGKVYAAAIVSGVLLGLFDTPLTVLLFPQAEWFVGFDPVSFVFQILLHTMGSLLQFWMLLGEEVGWMGYLYPRLERLHGTVHAIIFMGIIRGFWHLAMLAQSDFSAMFCNLLFLILSNILLGSVLVVVTKKSGSVIPAALIHALTNAIPNVYAGFLQVNETMYQSRYVQISLVSMLPLAAVGGIALWYGRSKSLFFSLKK